MAILLNNNFESKVSKVIKDDDANFLQLLVSCNELNINIINIYAPNNDQPELLCYVVILILFLIQQSIPFTINISTIQKLD